MPRRIPLVPLVLCVAALAWAARTRAQDATAPQAIDRLVAAERAFAARSLAASMRDAFVENLANDAIVFRPLPERGKPLWEKRQASAIRLAWAPEFAEVAAAGDLGWTTGPWEYQGAPDSAGRRPPPSFGHFVSVWALQADSTWRVTLDIGISHPDSASGGLDSVEVETAPAHAWASDVHKSPTARTDLVLLEQRYAADAAKTGVDALSRWAAADVRLNRDGDSPFLHRGHTRAVLSALGALRRILPDGSRVSASDDLGYTYGVLERAAGKGAPVDSSAYVHIWRRDHDGVWRIVCMVENPLRR